MQSGRSSFRSIMDLIAIVVGIWIFHPLATESCSGGFEGILSPPQQVIAYSGKRVSYNCTVCGSGPVFWMVNDTWSTSDSALGEPFSAKKHYVYTTVQERQSMLTIAASSATNLTDIQCLTRLSSDEVVFSDLVPIIVQGLLGAPTDPVANINQDSLTLSWTPPFSLTVIPYYIVNVTVSKSGQRSSFHTAKPKYQIMFAEHNINTSKCKRDYEVTISVCGVNPVGDGAVMTTTVTVQKFYRQLCAELDSHMSPTTTSILTVFVSTSSVFTHSSNPYLSYTMFSSPSSDVTIEPTVSHGSSQGLIFFISVPVTLLVVVTALIATILCMCTRLHKKGHKRSKHPYKTTLNDAYATNHCVKNHDVKTSINDAYAVTCPTIANKAYMVADEVHYDSIDMPMMSEPIYETISELPKQQ